MRTNLLVAGIGVRLDPSGDATPSSPPPARRWPSTPQAINVAVAPRYGTWDDAQLGRRATGSAVAPPTAEQAPAEQGTPEMDPTGQPLLELITVMDRLRSPGGCPWDAEQTHESLVSYLTEEAHEAVEAIETGDRAAIREELGDVLLQVIFHARIAQEDPTDPWSIDEVAQGIAAKLVARHPHVFGDETADSAAHVESVWLARKTAEKSRESVLDGIPAGLPALLLAAKMHYRVTHGGVVEPVPSPEARSRSPAARRPGLGPHRGVGELLLALAPGRGDRVASTPSRHCAGALRDYAERVRAAEPRSRSDRAPPVLSRSRDGPNR